MEVYVQSFPEPGRKVRVSLDGGILPAWFDGGRQLGYFNVARREILAVPVMEGQEFEPGPPRKLADAAPDDTSAVRFGDRMQALVGIATNRRPRDIRLILDWTALVER